MHIGKTGNCENGNLFLDYLEVNTWYLPEKFTIRK